VDTGLGLLDRKGGHAERPRYREAGPRRRCALPVGQPRTPDGTERGGRPGNASPGSHAGVPMSAAPAGERTRETLTEES